MYELSSATFAVADRTLLSPLDLRIAAGKVVGLIGHNGSGKSTLLKLLARQQKPTAGTIAFQGRDLQQWGSREFARKVAYLQQTPPSAAGMTVRELVALGRYPWHGALGRFSDEDAARVEEALRRTDVLAFADRLVDALSGGERQRVWLAMLVAQNPECMLLDEPISALDIGHQIEVLDLVRDLSRQRQLGVIVVLHDINMAARFCDELIALRAGRLLLRGTPGELMAPEHLQAIYGVPMGVLPHPESGVPMSFVR
ncbi:iron complex transport system ATP-binding protein [Faunimonas pinastri]|uniref:Iron complex transport system ATP-binding protein n=1 Tax=Faunimonas pinastri TaxID=1855383 RepID=A0A1H9FYZ8_9HYPH|nr:ATP-binding cassette domain-containing protein [Faunimonas pinastri]SEQ42708.1 iron complex transport system ATP-binding protein [Faunimonas pinastri]